jgi:hypothetical protein
VCLLPTDSLGLLVRIHAEPLFLGVDLLPLVVLHLTRVPSLISPGVCLRSTASFETSASSKYSAAYTSPATPKWWSARIPSVHVEHWHCARPVPDRCTPRQGPRGAAGLLAGDFVSLSGVGEPQNSGARGNRTHGEGSKLVAAVVVVVAAAVARLSSSHRRRGCHCRIGGVPWRQNRRELHVEHPPLSSGVGGHHGQSRARPSHCGHRAGREV